MSHFYLIEREVELRRQEMLREAEKVRLLREARPAQQGWLSRQRCWLLRNLGQLLVTLGQHLLQYGQPRAILLEGQVNGGALSANGQ
jgi:hypothetical protein